MKCFSFKLGENICLDAEQDKDIIYKATLSKTNKEVYVVSWLDISTNKIEKIEFHKETVEGALKDGDWIIVDEPIK